MLLTLTVSMSVAKDIMPEKRIYLLDLSGSMIGQGSVRTDNVLEKMKSDLEATVDWTSLPTDFVFIPFTDRLMTEFGGTDTKKQELMTEISSIETEAGNTDIASAWECALGKLDSTKVNYIFLLSDGYHNRGISKAGLNSLLKSWPQSTGCCDAVAYFVLLSPKYRTSEIARIFDETDKMSVVESMNICRQAFDVEQTEQQLDNSITVAPDDTNKSCSLLWLWILIAIILIALIIWTIVYWWPQISAVFARMIPGAKPVSGQSPKPGTAQKNKPDKTDKDLEDEWKYGYWTGKIKDSTFVLYKDKRLPNRTYTNLKNQTIGEMGKDLKDMNPQIRYCGGYPVFDRDFCTKNGKPLTVVFDEGIKEFLNQDEIIKSAGKRKNREKLHQEAYQRMAQKYGVSKEEIKVFKGDSGVVPALMEKWNCSEKEVWKRCNNPHQIQRVIHECEDCKTVQLVPRLYHFFSHEGGIDRVVKEILRTDIE